MTQLPSYINPSANRGVAQRALANAPISSPPYLSIKGNRFTLVDAAGNTRQFQTLYADVVVVDVNDHLSKLYFPDAYVEGDASPPLCWSDNGVAPSRNAGQPQAPTCSSCKWGEWGSKISNMGSRIKACSDLQKIGLIVPGLPGQEFLLRIPPNSLKNWGGYLATFRYGYDISDVVTRLTFQEGVQGTLEFAPAPAAFFDNPQWAQCGLLQAREQAWANPGVKAMIGATDVPAEGLVGGPGFRGGALPAPVGPASASVPGGYVSAGNPTLLQSPPAQTQFHPEAQLGFQPPAPGVVAPTGSPGFVPQGQPLAIPTQPGIPTQPSQGFATTASPSSPPAQQPRRRRTQAQIATDNAAKAAQPNGQQAPGQALTAPFPHPGQPQPQPQPGFTPAPGAPGFIPGAPAAPTPPAGGPSFGIGQGVAPDPAMEQMLKNTFGPGFRGPGQ